MSIKSKIDKMIEKELKYALAESSVLSPFKKMFAKFPRDAKSWSQATDEMRDMAKLARQYYNELELDLTDDEVEDEGKGIQSLNFRSFKTPSEWNSKAQDFIIMVYNKMSPQIKKEFLVRCKELFKM